MVVGEIEFHQNRAWESPLDTLGLRAADHSAGFQCTKSSSSQIAGDAMHRSAIGAVGRQVDRYHRISRAQPIDIAGSKRRIGGQIKDAVMVLGQLQFSGRTQHPG